MGYLDKLDLDKKLESKEEYEDLLDAIAGFLDIEDELR